MIVTINDHSFNTKDVAFLIKDKKCLAVSLLGGRHIEIPLDVEEFFKVTYLSKKDFIKLKNYFISIKKVAYIGPQSDEDTIIGFNGFGRYIGTSKTEHAKLVEAFKEVNNWSVAFKKENVS